MLQRDLDQTFGIRLSKMNEPVVLHRERQRSRQVSNLKNNSIQQDSLNDGSIIGSPVNAHSPFSLNKTTVNGFKKIKATCLLTSGEIVAQVVQRQDSGKML